MEKNINVMDFVDGFKKAEDKDAYVDNTVVICDYIPYTDKMVAAQNIVKATYYSTSEDDLTDGGLNRFNYIKINSPLKYVFYIHAIYLLYTNITYPLTNLMEAFDELERNGINDYIISRMSERELSSFTSVLQVTGDDLITNEYEMHSFISKSVGRITRSLKSIFSPVANKFIERLSNCTEEDLAKIIPKIEKMLDRAINK